MAVGQNCARVMQGDEVSAVAWQKGEERDGGGLKLLNRVHEADFSNHQGRELKKRTGVALDAPQ